MKLRAAILTCAVAIAIAACGSGSSGSGSSVSGSSSASPLKVGAVISESGALDTLGVTELAAIQAAVTTYNQHGGIDGHKIQLTVVNDQSTPSLSATATRKLIQQDGAQVIIGPDDQGLTAAAAPIAIAAHVPMLQMGGNWPITGLSTSESTADVFPVIPDTNTLVIKALVDQILLPQHYTKVGVLLDNTSYSLAFEAPMAKAAKANGLTVTTQVMPAGSTDATAQALNLLKAHPDIIVVGSPPGPDSITSIKAIRAQSPTIPIYVDQASASAAFASAVGASNLNNVDIIQPATSDVSLLPAGSPYLPDSNAFLAAMKAQGKYPTPATQGTAFLGWTAMSELKYAITAAKSTSSSALVSALQHESGYVTYIHWARTPSNYGGIAGYAIYMVKFANGQFVKATSFTT
jgi:branched-chain amino acid transport system substrate-binding protein